ncbi:uncharacterized protein LOC128221504 [Mya arenaria]|uniref:uncharacterized protein LOC128221504 n=1 Tax=Mya arenaria TaxID=6604 RepID=UPI0022DEE809|nr:uncharacterized protein LOC128221504 [Mya arenaria]
MTSFILKESICFAQEHGSKVYVAFQDCRKAFDKVINMLETSGYGICVFNITVSSPTVADDMLLISHSANGLQAMLDISPGADSLYCLNCHDVSRARNCEHIKECGPHEVCVSTLYRTSNGNLRRTVGCRGSDKCGSNNVIGKRADGAGILCDECCNTPFCQAGLCGDENYNQVRGPICYNCAHQLDSNDCSRVVECSRDEVCTQHAGSIGAGSTSECMERTHCEKLRQSLPASGLDITGTNGTCFNCCEDDICNNSCTLPTQSPNTACVDRTQLATCKLAAGFVCGDKDKARNAGCLHHCGYC